MTLLLSKSFYIPVLILAAYSLIVDPVTTFPTGMEEAAQYFSTTIHTITTVIPWAEVPFELMMWALGIQTVLFTISIVRWIIELLS